MANVSWLDKNIYAVILTSEEDKRLQGLGGEHTAGSTILKGFIESGLALGERVENKVEEARDGS